MKSYCSKFYNRFAVLDNNNFGITTRRFKKYVFNEEKKSFYWAIKLVVFSIILKSIRVWKQWMDFCELKYFIWIRKHSRNE